MSFLLSSNIHYGLLVSILTWDCQSRVELIRIYNGELPMISVTGLMCLLMMMWTHGEVILLQVQVVRWYMCVIWWGEGKGYMVRRWQDMMDGTESESCHVDHLILPCRNNVFFFFLSNMFLCLMLKLANVFVSNRQVTCRFETKNIVMQPDQFW